MYNKYIVQRKCGENINVVPVIGPHYFMKWCKQ